MKALIVAGGKGERLKPLTDDMPKPMVKINGKPILEYLIELLRKNDVKDILITLCHLPDFIKDYFGDGKRFGVNIKYFIENEPLGTVGALKKNSNFFDSAFIVMYGDNLTNIDLSHMIDFHRKNNGIGTVALHKKNVEERSSSYVKLDNKEKIEDFVERPTEEDFKKIKTDYITVNAGIYILEPEVLNYISNEKVDFAYDLFPLLLKKGKSLFGFKIEGYYRELGTLEKFTKVLNEIELGEVDGFVINGAKGVFLDRDGVINEIIYDEDKGLLSPGSPEEFKILPNVKEAVSELKKNGFKIIVIANQPGVVMGHFTKENLDKVTEKMKKELEIDAVYYCLHHPKFTGECNV